jgi:predicted glutamine amidotransferase
LCGIAGYIGSSTDPSVTYRIVSKLFERLEVRGIDASGLWGVNTENTIAYHKEPIRSSHFVQGQIWRSIKAFNAEVLLIHARQASIGVGEPRLNLNNHPFVSSDWTLGLIHNGRINEFEKLRTRYEIISQCDSEVLLRILEAVTESTDFPDLDKHIAARLGGIQSIFKQVRAGHMAVAIGERLEEGSRELWLFRNEFRTLWAFDLRDSLGQVFFCSTPDIWQDALSECRALPRSVAGRDKMIEIPVDEVWHFHIDPNNPCPTTVDRYLASRAINQGQDDVAPWIPYRRGIPKGRFLTGLPKAEPPPQKGTHYLADCEELQRFLEEIKKMVKTGVAEDEELDYVLSQAKAVMKDCITTVRAHSK